MLQFIVENNDKYSIPELCQMAIEGGCQWLQLRLPESTDAELRELAAELVPLCKENLTILTIENHVEMAKELGLHGVHLRDSKQDPFAVRELLGPEAIIGVEVTLASTALGYVGADIDYITFPPSVRLERISENVEALRDAKFELPIVAEGNFTVDEIPDVLATRVSGIAEGKIIADSKDPVKKTEELLNALKAK